MSNKEKLHDIRNNQSIVDDLSKMLKKSPINMASNDLDEASTDRYKKCSRSFSNYLSGICRTGV
ncbi:hypothetical protein J3D55_002147 [Chryseobacterium ginsenosidimutans]|uniref:hypothetical protein n=1 Tax=Chryseobacterium ginsenosidimutans TaxID=687846 RepID=UPI00216775C4|nr:hypothetical protein [Chryseobacterium ginsenosidimutans]MCS3869231.1 hypothetical protein [Chryseobacterium ginsenosidimutans]